MRIGGIGSMRYEVYRIHAHMNLITETAKVVYGEAGGVKEDEERLWVAHVVKNRYMLQRQGKYRFGSIRKDFVGYKRWESNWKRGKIEGRKRDSNERKAWKKSLKAAWKAWTSKHDPTHGAVFFVQRDYIKERYPEIDPYNAKEVNDKLKLSSYPLETVKPPKGLDFAHVFYRIKR